MWKRQLVFCWIIVAVSFPGVIKSSGVDLKSFLLFHYGRTGSSDLLPADSTMDGKTNIIDIESSSTPDPKALRIRLSKSHVLPGETYTLIAVDNIHANGFYSGNLEVAVTACDANNLNCSASQGPWRNFDGAIIFVNGAFTVTIPPNAASGTFTMRFRPFPNNDNLSWSNQTKLNITTTSGLQNSRDYVVYWSGQKTFEGVNYAYDVPFTTQVNFEAPQSLCGVVVRPMTFTKDNVYGYWNPAMPWYNELWSGTPNWEKNPALVNSRFQQDLRWYLVDWTRKNGWHDTWLTAYGQRVYDYAITPRLSKLVESGRYGSQDQTIPNYFLTPEWIADGWGLGTNKAQVGKTGPAGDMCSIGMPPTTSIWSVHADFLTLVTNNNSFPALRLRYYEGHPSYLTGGNFLREDWWFVKNQGLVRIDTKNFGITPGNGRNSCVADNDCLINDIMLTPHMSMIRSDFR